MPIRARRTFTFAIFELGPESCGGKGRRSIRIGSW
jgi:hypothetical protein